MSGDNLQKMTSISFGGASAATYSLSNGATSSTSTNAITALVNSSNSNSNSGSNKVVSTAVLSPLSLTGHRYVKLNVGGRLFSTSIDTLTKQDNMLRAMFSGRMDVTADADGFVLIDRCGKHFEFVLNYLRDEDSQYANLALDDKSEIELYEILKEAKFYCIQSLITFIEQKILSNKSLNSPEPYYGASVVSMITSKNDLIKILSSTDKPCIRLLINRHNNKYSYTNNSDDNLLKNIELFERMAIKFKNRIMFIKDTLSNEEICCWYFHGGGRKLAEVCCTSIVYTTEKKQTKVEFPDSKILEEIFVNAVLFESKDTASKEDTQSQQQMPNNQQAMYAYGTSSIDQDDQDEMPRISLSSTATAQATTQGGSIVVNNNNNCSANVNSITTTSLSNGMGASSSGGNPITSSLSNIGSAVNSSSNGSNSNNNSNTTSSRRSVR